MNSENTIITISDIETINQDEDVKINIYQRKSDCVQIAETEKIEDEPDICCICLDNMYGGDTYTYATCKHAIHEECYKELTISNRVMFCPLCRSSEPRQDTPITETIVENLDDGNVRIINIINLRVSRVHPENIRLRNNLFRNNKFAIIMSMLWMLILIGVIIFALTPLLR